MTTIFRPYSTSDSLRSDRSAGDRLRHRQKVREALRQNIADIVAEEAILTKGAGRIVKVPIRGIKEYRFVYGSNGPRVGAAGPGGVEKGQVVGRAPGEQGGAGKAGSEPGVDHYETDITVEELVGLMFEDLQLPELERKRLRARLVDNGTRRHGYRNSGIRVHLDKKRTVTSRIRRRVASGKAAPAHGGAEGEAERFPFHRDDLRYRRRVPHRKPESNAVVICLMDTSGSMDVTKKYLARSFFFLLYQFVRARYQNTDLVFVTHDTVAREVSEDDFFHKGESGGTMISSGYRKALEIIQERFHPSLWNVYAFHCSDGDNFGTDDAAAIQAARELCEVANLFGYGEVGPRRGLGEATMLRLLKQLQLDNFHAVEIAEKEAVWPSLRAFLSKDRGRELVAA